MTELFVVYSSEDEGFRFPVGKPFAKLDEAVDFVESNLLVHELYAVELLSLTDKQLENTAPPMCHGEVVKVYQLDGAHFDPKVLDTDSAYAWDYAYIIKLAC